jgi:hypothetical protein
VIADALKRDGIAGVGVMSSATEILDHLNGRQTHHGHVKGASVAQHQPGNSSCWSMSDVLAAPNFFEFALGMVGTVREYLRQEPLLYSVNAFTTYPVSGPMNPDIQEWHRDRDDVRFVALFIYLTDVLRPEDGAHLFQVGTHDGRESGPIRTVLGRAGTAFLADTRGLHMGVRPVSLPRTMAWARWCVSDPPASYVWDRQSPCSREVLGARYPTNEGVRASIRLVVQ